MLKLSKNGDYSKLPSTRKIEKIVLKSDAALSKSTPTKD